MQMVIKSTTMKNILLLSFLLLVFNQQTYAQSLINNRDYNNLHNWDIYRKGFNIQKNDISEKENTFYLSFSKKNLVEIVSWGDEKNPGDFTLSTCLVIPEDSIHFSFNCNSLKVDTLLLKVNLYKENEVLLEQLIYPLEMNGLNEISFSGRDACVMETHIYGKSMMQYDSIGLKITDFNLYASNHNLANAITDTQARLNTQEVTPLSMIYELDEFKNKRIIGLGESIHGSRSIIQEKCNTIEKLCEDKNIKLICFEAGIDFVMNWDLYIQGIMAESYQNKIMEEVAGSFSEAELIVALLNKLREINRSRKASDRIHVVGLDLRREDFYVFEYLQAWRERGKSKRFLEDVFLKMDTLNYNQIGPIFSHITIINERGTKKSHTENKEQIIPEEKRYSSLNRLMNNNEELKALMSEKEFQFFTESFLLNIPTKNDKFQHNERVGDKRDEYMWKILQLAIACYAPNKSDRIIIGAHSLHLSRTHNPYSISPIFRAKSLGEYIAEVYDDFFTVSIHVGRGKYKTYEKGIVAEAELQEPLYGSFEWMADKTKLGDIYCRTSALDTPNSFRHIGNRAATFQFYPLSKTRFDGYIYKEESESCIPVQYDHGSLSYRRRIQNDYIDSLKLNNTPYSSFNFEVFTDSISNVEVFNPEGFRWKSPRFSLYYSGNLNYAGIFCGFFESKDRDCIIIIDNMMFPKSSTKISSSKISFFKKRNIIAEAENSFLSPKFEPINFSDKSQPSQDGENVSPSERLNYKSEAYAKQVFNADKVAEASLIMSPNDRLHIFGPYEHGEAILIEKDGGTINLKCFYTDKGYKNKKKYRKAIESLVRFR